MKQSELISEHQRLLAENTRLKELCKKHGIDHGCGKSTEEPEATDGDRAGGTEGTDDDSSEDTDL